MARWPNKSDIGRLVATAGTIYLDIEPASPYNYGRKRILQSGFQMVLRDIDSDEYAYCYHHIEGVIKVPVQLLVTVRK